MSDKDHDEDFGEDHDEFDEEEMDVDDEVDIIDDEDDKEDGDGFKSKRGYQKNKDRITAKFLTKYERARILGTRAL